MSDPPMVSGQQHPRRHRPRVVIAKTPRSDARHWSAAAGHVLDSFADWHAVTLDPASPVAAREAQLDAALVEAEALLLCGWGAQGVGRLGAERLQRAPRLQFIGSTCHYRQAEFVDMTFAPARGIAFCETAPVMSPWVAEHELTLALAALRRIPQEHEIVGRGGWVDMLEVPDWPDRLHGRRVGLASFGEIHRHLARFLAPFQTDWEAYDPFVPAERIEAAGGRKTEDLVALAARSEVFFVATPPTPATLGSIGREVVDALPRDAVFVLVSRMAVVDQAPLLARLERGELRAAIDVYEPEPPAPDSPWRTLPNVIHTPHRAGNTRGAHQGVFLAQCEEARRHFAGQPLRYPLRLELVALFQQ
jgi:phosphoglycerate dehydrogenase-like enzyme